MRQKHLLLIPVFLVASLFLWVLYNFEKLPTPARWAGGAIAILACVIFIFKHIKLERDLKKGIVTVINGIVKEKRKMGGRILRGASAISPSSTRRNKSSTSYYLFIDNRKFNVPVKIYSKVKEGDHVRMDYFPASQYCLGIDVLS